MCSKGYTHIAGECFIFSSSQGTDMTWELARHECKNQGDELAVPGDVEAFRKYVGKMSTTFVEYFVGGYYKYQQGLWKWINDKNIKIHGNFWATDSSRNYSNPGETHCLTVFPSEDKFRDRSCEVWKRYICQKNTTQSFNHHDLGNTLAPTEQVENQAPLGSLYYAVGAILLILVILAIALGIYIHRKRKQSKANVNDSKAITDESRQQQPMRHDSENSLYGQAMPVEENRPRRHDSENSLYGQI
ncbi:unnamed protein product, partial [Meganyctiphanes norvegica]|uniref:C-type lectin domain-containing protein n=1 Tax=Meganyctiphanes norvegica TaxID=48144 RepID=A0AAV2SG93_MEGNR